MDTLDTVTHVTNGNRHAQRIRYLSRWLAAACVLLAVLLPITVAGYWAFADEMRLAVRVNLPGNTIQEALLPWQRFAGAAITGIPLGLMLIGLWQARKCFRLFAAGQIFTTEAVACLSRFAGWTAASVLAGMIASTAVSALITLNNPPGMRHIAVGIGSDQVFSVLFATMVWLMAAVIGQGKTLADENAAFV